MADVASKPRVFRMLRSLCAAGFALAFGTTAAFSQECQPRIADEYLVKPGHLLMATSPTLPPMAYADAQGNLKGLRIELGLEIAKRLCLTPEYISIEYAAMVPGLNGKRWDMINAGLFVTAERRKILIMIPYENLAISISSLPGDDSIKSIDDLAGKTLSSDIGGYAERKIKELNEDFKTRGKPQMKISLFDNFATVYQALRAGQVDAAVSIDPVARQYDQLGDFKQVLKGLYPTPGSLSMVSAEVAEEVSAALKEMKSDGTFDSLMTQYGVTEAPGGLEYLPLEG
jgi:polar amino acid transport system substrate-binding protein